MNFLSLVGPWLDNIYQIRWKWYYSSVWNFFSISTCPYCIFFSLFHWARGRYASQVQRGLVNKWTNDSTKSSSSISSLITTDGRPDQPHPNRRRLERSSRQPLPAADDVDGRRVAQSRYQTKPTWLVWQRGNFHTCNYTMISLHRPSFHKCAVRPVSVEFHDLVFNTVIFLRNNAEEFHPLKLSIFPWNFYYLSSLIQCHVSVFNVYETL
jgi:hypothetical protein